MTEGNRGERPQGQAAVSQILDSSHYSIMWFMALRRIRRVVLGPLGLPDGTYVYVPLGILTSAF